MTLNVNLAERSYDIEIATARLDAVGAFIAARSPLSHAVVVTDENVHPYAERVAQSLEAQGARVDTATLPPGESTKSVGHVAQLWQQCLAFRADRKSVVVAVGGGVIGDLAGFIAATYARGIAFFQVPTTLLAQVDSSVGGKVGINLPGAKNMVGAFWQPRGVFIDTEVLATLPDREFRAGMAEVVKYGVILDRDFFAYLEAQVAAVQRRDPEVLRRLVHRSCELKAEVVTADEREETGLRAVLNYGHTFCHAIEAATDYGAFLHGEAVAIGMLCASRLAEAMGRIDHDVTRRQGELLEAFGLQVELPEHLARHKLLEAMRHDKKVEHGRLRFVLPSRLGHVELVDGVTDEQVLAALG